MTSHFRRFKNKLSSVEAAETRSMSPETMDSGPLRVISSRYSTTNSLDKEQRSGWIVRENRTGPRGSPCWHPSSERTI